MVSGKVVMNTRDFHVFITVAKTKSLKTFIYDSSGYQQGNVLRQDLVLIPFSDGIYEWKICMLTRKNEVVGNGVDIFQKHIKLQIDKIQKGIITR